MSIITAPVSRSTAPVVAAVVAADDAVETAAAAEEAVVVEVGSRGASSMGRAARSSSGAERNGCASRSAAEGRVARGRKQS